MAAGHLEGRKDTEMSKLLDLMERIREGAPAPLGFGAARAATLPGLALVGRVNRPGRRRPRGLTRAAAAHLDAAIVDDASGREYLGVLGGLLPDVAWGPRAAALTEEEVAGSREAGADLIAFTLESAAAALAGQDDLARLLSLRPEVDEPELRATAALPVDAFILDLRSVDGDWTLRDLVRVGSISRRVDKYVLVEVGQPPRRADLEALRDTGVSGLVVDVANLSQTALAALKEDLLAMPRPRPRRRERRAAAIPSSAFAPAAPAPPQREDEDDWEED